MNRISIIHIVMIVLLFISFTGKAVAAEEEFELRVKRLMEEYPEVPGLCVVVVRPDRTDYIKGFGYSDLENRAPVDSKTRFQLASCSKSFTALAILKMEQDGLVHLDDPVRKYLPWFSVQYKGKVIDVTLRQCLHHTSGIPTKTISGIPQDNGDDALEKTVRGIVGISLDSFPGQRFQYATINYDIIALVIQNVARVSFEQYIAKTVFEPLQLRSTQAGVSGKIAQGYKQGFFKPRKYDAPLFRGNNAAGYIVTNGEDMARWLKFQLGLIESPLTPLALETQKADPSVAPDLNNLSTYGMGWMQSISGSGIVLHTGLNPNFSAIMLLHPRSKYGIAVLANSNSALSQYMGWSIVNALNRIPNPAPYRGGDSMDRVSSILSYALIFILICAVGFCITVIAETVMKRRLFEKPSLVHILKILALPIAIVPFIIGIYIIPEVMMGFSWEAVLVWGPISMLFLIKILVLTAVVSYIGFILSSLFVHRNIYLRTAPMLIVLSLLTGGANALIIFLISSSLYSSVKWGYLIYYFGLAMALYIIGRKTVQTRLVRITLDIVYDLRIKLIERVFSSSFQQFEKIDSGRFVATLNNDTAQISTAANLFVGIVTSIVTIIGAFMYLASVAFWATFVTLIVVIIISTLYYSASRRAGALLQDARDTQNIYLALLNGITDGFKELSLKMKRKQLYKTDIENTSNEFRIKQNKASVKFINAFIIGETLLIAVLGAVAFLIPIILPSITKPVLMSFIMVLLYLIGPVGSILTTIPQLVQMRIAWNRIQEFMEDLPANPPAIQTGTQPIAPSQVHSIKARGVIFQYTNEEGSEVLFSVGPMDFEAEKGQIIFIIGGNGSGKTTLAKLLTGLYIPNQGKIFVNDQEIGNAQLGEYFSVVFGDYHLFEKLYDIDVTGREEQVQEYLELLKIKDKVALEEDSFSTIDLSAGQRKRLALLRCYLEDSPIFLFDELAADQDPQFRKFFYRDLLIRMKEKGKIIIAITHDDHYFDVADKVIKMDMGKIDVLEEGLARQVTR